jgi:hypothetical protein
MIIVVVHRFPPNCRLVALIWLARSTHTSSNRLKFTLDSVPLSVGVRTQLDF